MPARALKTYPNTHKAYMKNTDFRQLVPESH